MKYVVSLLSLFTILSTESIATGSEVPYFMYNAANSFQVDVALLYAICTVESRCRPGSTNHNDGTKAQKDAGVVSKSHGMFQIKLATARALGFKESVKKLYSPEINTWYAAKYLKSLYNRYGDTVKVVSAYNAGRYTKANKVYVNKVLQEYVRYKVDKRL